MARILLSVVTINKNNASGLRHTINCIEIIQNSHLEHVIIDGNSKDESIALIQSYIARNPNSNINYISGDDNGIWDAMNKGAALSSGDYLMFINSGDEIIFINSFFEFQNYLSVIQPLWAFGDAERINAKSRSSEAYFDKACLQYPEFVYGLDWIPHGASVVKKSFFMSLGGFSEPEWSLLSDQGMFMKLWQAPPPIYTKDLLLRFENGGVHEAMSPVNRYITWRKARLVSYQLGALRPQIFHGVFLFYRAFFAAIRNSVGRILSNL